MLLSSLWNLSVSLLLSPRTLLLSWLISLSITVHSTRYFRRLATSGNTAANLDDNELGSTESWYSSTPFQYGKIMSPYSSVPHACTDAYKASIFSGFVASHPPVGNVTFCFFFHLIFLPVCVHPLKFSAILDCDLSAPQCWPIIRHWWINVLFGSTLLLLMLLSFVLSCLPWIKTGNETGSPSGFWGDFLALCRTIIYSLK